MPATADPRFPAAETVCQAQSVDPSHGLNEAEVIRRRQVYGLNSLGKTAARPWIAILAGQFKSLFALILLGAAGLSYLLGDVSEAVAILIVVLLNAAVGFLVENRATRAMDALRQMGRATTRVRRDGSIRPVPDEELVPGDIVLLEAGDVVTADIRLVEWHQMQCDESLLTGESVPVDKGSDTAGRAGHDPARVLTAFKGTSVTRGTGTGVVMATGLATELGHIAEIAETAEASVSPLEERLQRLSGQLLFAVFGLTLVLAMLGILSGRDTVLMIKTGVALAVAAIPEGLPIVATLALARGMWKLAARNALIERLSAVETLGSVTLILTDKTGTLTENRMTATRLLTPERPEGDGIDNPGETGRKALRVCALCYTGANPDQLTDPMETALVAAAARAGLTPRAIERTLHRVGEHAFDPDIRMMATVHQASAGYLYAVKGAPEAVLAAASRAGTAALTAGTRLQWIKRMRTMAQRGLRVLAVAEKTGAAPSEAPYENLSFLGLIGLEDPPRADAAAAVAAAQAAGIRVVMATGDSAETGLSVAAAVGIASGSEAEVAMGDALSGLESQTPEIRAGLLAAPVFARMSPHQKLDLIDLHQHGGAVVAMTGDGVNDAPALKKADVGIAMGLRGTEVAKQAAAMILKDDAFASIVVAIQQGRVIFANIRQFVVYLLSCNLSEVLVVTAAILIGLPLPLLPLQILFLNLVTDVFPALALGFGEGHTEILHRPPRPKSEGLLQRRHWQAIVGYAAVMTVAALAAFVWALEVAGRGGAYANTVAFFTLALGQLWHVFNMRSRETTFFNNQVVRNRLVWLALVVCVLLMAATLSWPALQAVLQLQMLDGRGWAVVLIASLAPLALGQAGKAIGRKSLLFKNT